MTSAPQPITKIVGKTERTLQALLDTQLRKAGVSFPEWTLLVYLSSNVLARAALLSALEHGQIVRGSNAVALIAEVEAKGLIQTSEAGIELTDAGKNLFNPLLASVQAITAGLVTDISDVDLETTNRTLALVTARAERVLTETFS